MNFWNIGVFLLQIVCSFLGGMAAWMLTNWGIRRILLGLDYRLTECEERVNREVKIRASEASRKNKNFEKDLLDQINVPAQPELDLLSWRNKKFTS